MGGVEVYSTPSLRHLEEILFEKVESPGRDEVGVGVAVAAVLTGTVAVLTGTVKPFGATLKKASKK
jgi:hypothetical protein